LSFPGDCALAAVAVPRTRARGKSKLRIRCLLY
jgi:hypothetical protein